MGCLVVYKWTSNEENDCTDIWENSNSILKEKYKAACIGQVPYNKPIKEQQARIEAVFKSHY